MWSLAAGELPFQLGDLLALILKLLPLLGDLLILRGGLPPELVILPLQPLQFLPQPLPTPARQIGLYGHPGQRPLRCPALPELAEDRLENQTSD